MTEDDLLKECAKLYHACDTCTSYEGVIYLYRDFAKRHQALGLQEAFEIADTWVKSEARSGELFSALNQRRKERA